jgi:hypothetical protein
MSLDRIGGLLKAAAAVPSFDVDVSSLHQQASTWPQNRNVHELPLTHISQTQVPHGQSVLRKRACRRKRMCMLNIASHLNELEGEDPNKVLIVRRINRLGFESGTILKEHYERYGPVSKVLLSNAHAKQSGTPFPVRLRPSGIGYLLFEHAESAAKALAEGQLQTVKEVEICVRAYKARQTEEDACNDAEDGNAEEVDDVEHQFP